MNLKTVFLIVFLLALVVGGLFVYVSRPTQEPLSSDIDLYEKVDVDSVVGDVDSTNEVGATGSAGATDATPASLVDEEKTAEQKIDTANQNIIKSDYKVSDEYLDHIKNNMLSGGPPKDGIPSIDNAKYLSADKVSIADDQEVFGVNYNGFVAAYPKNIMYWHEIVNEKVEDEKISITYCPLTGSVIGYLGKNLGVSGGLYNSNLVMYDRATDYLVPQILGVALDGTDAGEPIETFDVTVTTWKQWRQAHPDTLVLSEETGQMRDYTQNPYPGYDNALRVWFPLSAESDKFHSKELVHGIEIGKESFAIVKSHLKVVGSVDIETEKGTLTATYDRGTDTVKVEGPAGEHVKNFEVYWFAWYAFHPNTKVVE